MNAPKEDRTPILALGTWTRPIVPHIDILSASPSEKERPVFPMPLICMVGNWRRRRGVYFKAISLIRSGIHTRLHKGKPRS
ncbi:hypothetical protein RvY_09178 [Ramazzottius varieornatus]|uniref:Uncharacterized protein n=1 Tax=Ramazzottius varieornatus TaxID=947166 RepID=A0A1D1V8J1_RAMVA|nr:hypothetical protein RvY_09178 [Ramazzottius varieornatus]